MLVGKCFCSLSNPLISLYIYHDQCENCVRGGEGRGGEGRGGEA